MPTESISVGEQPVSVHDESSLGDLSEVQTDSLHTYESEKKENYYHQTYTQEISWKARLEPPVSESEHVLVIVPILTVKTLK